MASTPRVIVVTRPTWYDQLLAAHGSHGQAAFFLQSRGQVIDEAQAAHELQQRAVRAVLAVVPQAWRRSSIVRDDLHRFLFGPEDVVVAVGQDGLVANVAKYLDGQPVVGINPDPSAFDGVLVRHAPEHAADLLHAAVDGSASIEQRAMVEARTSDGRVLRALNEVFVGHRTHQSARYELDAPAGRERHSSSGLVVVTGTGATGWGRSIHRERHSTIVLPAPAESRLAFFVREAWPSVATGTELTEGELDPGQQVEVTSRMDDGGVCFGDGIERDRIELRWGERLAVGVSQRVLRLVAT